MDGRSGGVDAGRAVHHHLVARGVPVVDERAGLVADRRRVCGDASDRVAGGEREDEQYGDPQMNTRYGTDGSGVKVGRASTWASVSSMVARRFAW